MVIAGGSLELAHARISARYGVRPDVSVWRRIESIRALPAVIDAIRNSPLRRWVNELTASSNSHEIENVLRGQWRREVGEVAAWMPDQWCPAVRWWATWIDVPVLEHLARSEPALPWMARDAVYRTLVSDTVDIEDNSGAAEFLPALRELIVRPDLLLTRWCDVWRAQMPSQLSDMPLLGELSRILFDHIESFAASAPGDGWLLRRALDERLALLFRRAILTPAAAFVYLALTALDLERLRAELVRHAIFTPLLATQVSV